MIDKHNSLSEKFLKKGFWLYLFSFIIAPIGYIIKIIISGELSVSEVGILYGVISLITLLAGFNDFGMTESMKKFVPQFVEEKKYGKVKTMFFIAIGTQLITSIIICCIFFFGSNYISLHFFKSEAAIEVLKIFSFFFIGVNLFQIISTFFISVQNTLLNKLAELIRIGAILFFTLGVFFTDNSGIVLFSYAWLFGLAVGIVFSYIVFFKKYYKVYLNVPFEADKALVKMVFGYAITIFIGLQAATILGQIDMQMILYILGAQSAGYYTNYLSTIGIPFMLLTPIFGFLFPVISQLKAHEDIKNIALLKKIFQKIFILGAILFSVFFFVFAKEILMVLFGEKFLPSADILRFSILFLVFNLLLQINFNIMSGVGYLHERVYIVLGAILFNITTNIILIPIYGASGAALATGIGWAMIWILSEYVLRKDFPLQLELGKILKNLLVFGGLGCVYLFLSSGSLLYIGRIPLLFVLVGIFACAIGLFLLINRKETNFFLSEVKKLRKKA